MPEPWRTDRAPWFLSAQARSQRRPVFGVSLLSYSTLARLQSISEGVSELLAERDAANVLILPTFSVPLMTNATRSTAAAMRYANPRRPPRPHCLRPGRRRGSQDAMATGQARQSSGDRARREPHGRLTGGAHVG